MPVPIESERPTSVRWIVAVLVMGFSFVSYMQRMNISLSAELMMPDLSLSKVQMGQVFSSFLWGYAIFQVFAGKLGDTLGPRITLTVAAVLWGAMSVLTGLLPGRILHGSVTVVICLLLLRFILGAAEAATYPVGARAIRNWTPPQERARGNAVMVAGSSIAAAVTSPLVSWLMLRVGWRESFYLTSSVAFAIAAVWYFVVTDHPWQHKWVNTSEAKLIGGEPGAGVAMRKRPASVRKLLTDNNVLLLSLTYTCEGYVLFIFVFWLFIYLVEVRGFSVLKGGMVSSLPWLTAMVCTPIGGFACDRITARKGRIAGARATIMLGYGLSGVLLFAAAGSPNRVAAVAALCLSVGFLYFAEPAFWTTATFLGGDSSGAVSGIMNTAGILGGIVSTSLVPVMVEHFGWMVALGSGAAVALLCTLSWFLIGQAGFAVDPLKEEVVS
jgi:ACS family glucarate transporter-like MFS transporter